jgi:hypothetical protein
LKLFKLARDPKADSPSNGLRINARIKSGWSQAFHRFSIWLVICLRQEFCELELLDEITKLRYEGKLPNHIQGNFRNPLIRAYQKWKGTDYVPPLTHPALTWSVKDPMPLLSVVTDAPWQKFFTCWTHMGW